MPNKHSTFPRSRTLQMSESNPVAGPEERTQLEESVKCSCTFAQSWQGTPRGGKQALQGGLEKMCAQTDQELLIYTGSCSAHDCAMALVDVEMCEVLLQLPISQSHSMPESDFYKLFSQSFHDIWQEVTIQRRSKLPGTPTAALPHIDPLVLLCHWLSERPEPGHQTGTSCSRLAWWASTRRHWPGEAWLQCTTWSCEMQLKKR